MTQQTDIVKVREALDMLATEGKVFAASNAISALNRIAASHIDLSRLPEYWMVRSIEETTITTWEKRYWKVTLFTYVEGILNTVFSVGDTISEAFDNACKQIEGMK